MQSRNTYSLVVLLLLTAASCAKQNAGAGFDDVGDDDDDDNMSESGSSPGGKGSGTAGGSMVSLSGGTSVSGKGNTGGQGGGTTLPPVGSSGKSGGGAAGAAGAGGKGGAGGAGGSNGGSASGGNVNMPIDGVSVTFMPMSMEDQVDYVGGELHLNDDAGPPLPYADMKIRYYFTDDLAGAPNATAVMMNWAQCGSKNNLGPATCTGTVTALPAAKSGADSYVELTCKSDKGEELPTEGMCKISWKAGANGNSQKQNQADDYSFTDPSKIVLLIGNKIIWGVEPK